jgi:integrase
VLGVPTANSPHAARHTFVTVGSQRRTELAALASVARHRDLNTTRRYLHLGGAEQGRQPYCPSSYLENWPLVQGWPLAQSIN